MANKFSFSQLARNVISKVIVLTILVLVLDCDNSGNYLKPKKTAGDKPELNAEEMKRLILFEPDYNIPLESARKDALRVAAELDKSQPIGQPRKIAEEFVGNVPDFSVNGVDSTKAGVVEMYLFNFADNKGYAIISGDKRAPGIMGSAAMGTLNKSVNPGINIFLSQAVGYINDQRLRVESLRDDVYEKLKVKLADFANEKKKQGNPSGKTALCSGYSYSYSYSEFMGNGVVVAPIMGTNWSQYSPFNEYYYSSGCTLNDCGAGMTARYLAGCVPISEAQVVAHFRAQSNSDWARIVGTPNGCSLSSSDKDLVATLTKSIFDAYGIYASAGCDKTSAGASFGDFQFTSPRGISPDYGLHTGEWTGYNEGNIYNSLLNGSPVIIQGFTDLSCFIWCWGSGEAHQWVLEGYQDNYYRTTTVVTTYYEGDCQNVEERTQDSTVTYTYYSYYQNESFYNNWGWGGGGNGYYLAGVYHPTNSSNNFNHANYLVVNITPL